MSKRKQNRKPKSRANCITGLCSITRKRASKEASCNHIWVLFFNHMSEVAEGRRCVECHRQEWF